MPTLLTLRHAARLLGVSPGRLWRVRASDLEAFFEASAQRPVLVPGEEERS